MIDDSRLTSVAEKLTTMIKTHHSTWFKETSIDCSHLHSFLCVFLIRMSNNRSNKYITVYKYCSNCYINLKDQDEEKGTSCSSSLRKSVCVAVGKGFNHQYCSQLGDSHKTLCNCVNVKQRNNECLCSEPS